MFLAASLDPYVNGFWGKQAVCWECFFFAYDFSVIPVVELNIDFQLSVVFSSAQKEWPVTDPHPTVSADLSQVWPEANQHFSKEIDDEANSYFQRIYNHPPHPTMSVDEVRTHQQK